MLSPLNDVELKLSRACTFVEVYRWFVVCLYSEWEATAIGVLDECRKQNDELAQRLIVKALPDFGYLTSIDIAVSAEDQDFIAHPTCQALLSKLWMGALDLGTHTWQVRSSPMALLIMTLPLTNGHAFNRCVNTKPVVIYSRS